MEEEPTITKYESENEEEEVGLLNTRSSRIGKAISSGDTIKSTVIGSSLGSASDSSSMNSAGAGAGAGAGESKGKGLSAVEIGPAEAVGSAEAPDLQQEPYGFHGEQNDGTNGSVYFDKDQGVESNGVMKAEPDAVESHLYENPDGETNKIDVQNGLTEKIKDQSTEIQEIVEKEEHLLEKHNASLRHLETKVQIIADTELIEDEEELDKELADEFDVESVLENQGTHDLYCPNCNSCITRRVVLKRRKRKIRQVLNESKRGKLDILRVSKPDANPIQVSTDNVADRVFSNDGAQSGAGDEDSERGPCLFRCLSCFSIFIPSGNGFKLFRISKNVREDETSLISREPTRAKMSWFFSIFGSNNKETAVEQVEEVVSVSQVNQLENPNPNTTLATVEASIISNDQSIAHVSDGTMVKSKESVQNITKNSSFSQKKGTETTQKLDITNETGKSPVGTEETIQDSKSEFLNAGLKMLVSSEVDKKTSAANGNEQEVQTEKLSSDKESLFPIQPSYDSKDVNQVIMGSHEFRTDAEFPMKEDISRLQEPIRGGVKRLLAVSNNNSADKLIPIIDSGIAEPKPSQILQTDIPTQPDNLLQSGIQAQVNETHDVESLEGRKLEILKSIVYGGLVESIASLGVISSAAGSGASTLNILVLGLANLIGGLVLIVHNLQELKEENTRTTTTDNNQVSEQEDRYQELLGKRQNFWLHAFVAILSFIIFGLIPPVVYGFSFRITNNKDYKSASVFAASLVCVILLAIGKARIKEPPRSYVKTVLYYTSIAIAASGISYIVGDVLRDLLEKYGWSDSSTGPVEVVMPLLGRKGFGFGSY